MVLVPVEDLKNLGMKFSSKAITFGKRAGLELPTIKAYLFSRYVGSPTHWFPDEYAVLDEVPMNQIVDDKLDLEWAKEWMAKWPTQSQTFKDTGVRFSYSFSGNSKQCKKKLKAFIKNWDEIFHRFNRGLPTPLPAKMEIIDQATDLYLAERKANNWEYTRKNHLFIEHEEKGSLLEDYCVRILEGDKVFKPRKGRMTI